MLTIIQGQIRRVIDGGPDRQSTVGADEGFNDLDPRWQEVQTRLQALIDGPVAELNELVATSGVPIIGGR